GSSQHQAANSPPITMALVRNARRMTALSALGSPALRRQHVPHTHAPCHPGQDEQDQPLITLNGDPRKAGRSVALYFVVLISSWNRGSSLMSRHHQWVVRRSEERRVGQ